MTDTTIEQFTKKNLMQMLDLVKSDMPDVQTPDGYKPDQWHAVCNGKLETLIITTLDLVDVLIREKQDAVQAVQMDEPEPPKKGRNRGFTDGYVKNGDVYYD